MYRLKCSGKPMLTSVQFYREANLPDLLTQREAFLQFAGAQLNLEGMNKPIFMLQKITTKPALLQEDQWLKELREELCDRPQLACKLEDVWQAVRCYFEQMPFPDSVSKEEFLTTVALTILISKLDPVRWKQASPEELLGAFLGKVHGREKQPVIQFGQEHLLTLLPLETPYTVPYNPAYPMDPKQEIGTYVLQASNVGTHECVMLDLGGQGRREIPRGDRLLVNVVEDTVVSVLPNQISAGGTSLLRKGDGTIYINGRRCPNTQTVTSFAVQEGTGLYFWADNGSLDGSYSDKNPQCGRYVQRIVEVALAGPRYYLLSAHGVLVSNDPIQEQLDRPLASLGALRKELIT